MKKSILIIASFVLIFSLGSVSAQNSCCSKGHMNNELSDNNSNNKMKSIKGDKITKFSVLGNCEMCETRIENAAKSVVGVQSAEWDKNTKMITITYNGDIEVNDIEKAIASAGHDTSNYKADDKVYNALPGCCKYDR